MGSPSGSRFAPGETIALRGLHQDGRVASAECGRVISDDDNGLLTLIPIGSHVMRRARLDGTPTRKLPLNEKLTVPTVLERSVWTGNTLILTMPDSRHAVWWFFTEDGEFAGWYVNLQSPPMRWWGGIDIRDHALDVIVRPDRSWYWKDEDEFADRTGHPWFWTEAEAAEIRAEGERVIAAVEAGAYPFDGSLCDFDAGGHEPAEMPWWWDQVLAHQVTARLPQV